MTKQTTFIRDLGEGLVLRRSTAADAEALAKFNAGIHGEDEMDAMRLAEWTKDLLRGNHPTFGEQDFTLVEDTNSGKIISSMNLISQTWAYEGIPFKVGRPELVGTDSDYRNRGLVRAQFETVHEWSRQRGELVQGITGIPFYYRQFGYEMTMNLGGTRIGFIPHVPQLEEGKAEPYRFRPAEGSDLPFMAQLYERGYQRSLVTSVRSEQIWQYEVFGKSAQNIDRGEFRIIENEKGERVGYLSHPCFNWFKGEVLVVNEFEIIDGASWLDISPSMVRYLWETGKKNAEAEKKEATGFGIGLHVQHPAYEVLRDRLPRERKPYAWYLRVPDVPAFLRHIQPVLEQRLAASVCAGYSGTLEISFYRSGVRLVFQDGRLAEIADWKPAPPKVSGQAAFPGLTFLHILFGYRSIEEIEHMFVDCWVETDAARAVLHALFPKKPSQVRMLA